MEEIDPSVETVKADYSNVLSMWRKRETASGGSNRMTSIPSVVVWPKAVDNASVEEAAKAMMAITDDSRPGPGEGDAAGDVVTIGSDWFPAAESVGDEGLEAKQGVGIRKALSLPRHRKMSAEEPRSTTQKQPLGYYGTMALINSRKYSNRSQQGLDLGLLGLSTDQSSLFSRSWHFDRIRSPNDSDNPVQNDEPRRKHSESQKDDVDGHLSKSFSDIMTRYKNAKKEILKKEQMNRRPSIESDSDSDMEQMKRLLERADSYQASSLKTESTAPAQRKRRVAVVTPDASPNLKPIVESRDTDTSDSSKGDLDTVDLKSKFAWSGNTDNLSELKALASKMRLNPRLSQYGFQSQDGNNSVSKDATGHTANVADERAAITRVDLALEYIRSELRNMHNEDQILAKKLMYIRKALRDVRLQMSCDEYRNMLDDSESNISDVQTMESVSSICEVPAETRLAPSLRNRGITKMNINRRRFSVL